MNIIGEQLTAMRNGDFTEEDLSQTKAVIKKNQILETLDTPRGLIELLYHDVVADYKRPMDTWFGDVDRVTRDEIIAVANKIGLDTIYLLQGSEEA
ncbi:hypothetical protein GCM10020331_048920 [Ectobacillus funiculus]